MRGLHLGGWIYLSPSEAKLARLVARGFDNSYIAKLLYTTEAAVRTRIHKLYKKLNIQSRFHKRVYLAKKVWRAIN